MTDQVVDAVAAVLAEPTGSVRSAAAQPAATVFVGFSGGLDSTVLLDAAARVLPSRSRLRAVHVNHGLQPDAFAWEAHCAAVCAALNVPLTVQRVSVAGGAGLEARARAARYGVFTGLLRGGGRLLLAHHRDDQIETALLRLSQGRGLYGMPAARPLGGGGLARPMLHLPRRVLWDYARERGLVWVEDSSNTDPAHARNRVRHRLLPELRRRCPTLEDDLLAALEQARHHQSRLLQRAGAHPPAVAVDVAVLQALAPAEQAALLRIWLGGRGLPAPTRAALADFLGQLDAPADRQPQLELAAGWRLWRHRGRVHLVAPLAERAERYPLSVPGVLGLPHGELRVVEDRAGFRPRGPVEVRFRSGGERLATGGRRRAVKQLLQEAGVPPWQRPDHPLLHDQAGLLAVAGLAHRDPAPAEAAAPGYRAEWRPRAR